MIELDDINTDYLIVSAGDNGELKLIGDMFELKIEVLCMAW